MNTYFLCFSNLIFLLGKFDFIYIYRSQKSLYCTMKFIYHEKFDF